MPGIINDTPDRNRLFELLKRLSFRTGEFVLASGKKSNYYLDCRITSLHAEGATVIGIVCHDIIKAYEAAKGTTIAAAGGMTLGADPLATAVSVTSFQRQTPIPAFIVRKEEKSHGRKGLVVGVDNIPQGGDVMMLEDVVTTGGSTLKAIDHVRDAGLNPVGVIALVDRMEGGAEALAKAGVDFFPIFTKDDFLAE